MPTWSAPPSHRRLPTVCRFVSWFSPFARFDGLTGNLFTGGRISSMLMGIEMGAAIFLASRAIRANSELCRRIVTLGHATSGTSMEGHLGLVTLPVCHAAPKRTAPAATLETFPQRKLIRAHRFCADNLAFMPRLKVNERAEYSRRHRREWDSRERR